VTEGIAVSVETAEGWTVLALPDGAALIFKLASGNVGVTIPHDDLGRFAELLVTQAGKLVGNRFPEQARQIVAANPVPVNALAIEPHPQDPSSALLELQAGNMRLTFAIDWTMLRAQCTRFLDRVQLTRPRHAN
jgi:hypothetical protein